MQPRSSQLVRWARCARRIAAAAGFALAPLAAPACERAQAPVQDRSPVRYHRAPVAPAIEPGDASLLERLGYLTGYRPAAGAGGVSVHDPARAFAGHNLYTSGHAPVALLVDMDGGLVHRWEVAYRDAFPDAPADALARDGMRYLRRVQLLEGGDLLAVFDYFGLVRLDRDSRVRWARAIPVHHDVFATGDRIYALAEEIHEVERLWPGRRVRDDQVLVLDLDGNELRRVSVLRALERSRFAPLLARVPPHDDVLHTNSVEILGDPPAGLPPAFRRGAALVSIRNLDLIAVLDLEREEIVWGLEGARAGFRLQHDPTLLRAGGVLLFDNLGLRRRSRALELDPATGRALWSWAGEEPFVSEGMGSAQRLPNGNTIVTDSFGGRAFEVERGGAVVWRFDNPARTGERGELVAVIPELQRLEAPALAGWLR